MTLPLFDANPFRKFFRALRVASERAGRMSLPLRSLRVRVHYRQRPTPPLRITDVFDERGRVFSRMPRVVCSKTQS